MVGVPSNITNEGYMGDIGYIFGYAAFAMFLLGVLVGYLISKIKEK